MNEGSRYDDTGAKVFADEKDPRWYLHAAPLGPTSGEGWKDGTEDGADENDKEGRDAEAEFAVEFITSIAAPGGVGVRHDQ